MNKAKKNFDEFTWQTRVMPVLVASVPLFFAAVAKGFSTLAWTEAGLMVCITVVVLSLLYRLTRNMGKKCERKITDRLGAMPSVILLRYSDSTIGIVSKQRYHERINKVYGLNLPLNISDERPEDDAQYDAAIRSLKNRANQMRDTEFRVYQELKEYHFFRNLYGIKPITFSVYLVLAIREICLIPNFNIKNLFINPVPNYVSFLIFIVGILLTALVTNKGVEERSFSYANALIESCERI